MVILSHTTKIELYSCANGSLVIKSTKIWVQGFFGISFSISFSAGGSVWFLLHWHTLQPFTYFFTSLVTLGYQKFLITNSTILYVLPQVYHDEAILFLFSISHFLEHIPFFLLILTHSFLSILYLITSLHLFSLSLPLPSIPYHLLYLTFLFSLIYSLFLLTFLLSSLLTILVSTVSYLCCLSLLSLVNQVFYSNYLFFPYFF